MSYYHVNEADEAAENGGWQEGLRNLLSKYLASSLMWPVGTLCAGPYSPFALEKRYPGQWREAFEDLLSTEVHGYPTREPSYRLNWMTRGDWLEFLGSNGLLKGWRIERDEYLLRFINLGDSPSDGLTITTDELADHFDFGRPCEVTNTWSCARTQRLLDAYGGTHNVGPKQVVSPPVAVVETKSVSPIPGFLLSELTASERTTMPDGSVMEKRVLKKRFADGRQEEAEEVEKWWDTVPENSSSAPADVQSVASSVPKPDSNQDTHQHENSKGTKGWFWS